jgi:hypothetical protein
MSSTVWRLAVVAAALAAPLGAQAGFDYVVVDPSGPGDPWGKSVGDLDGDGLPELLVAGNAGDLVAYHPPAFTVETIVSGGSFSTDLEVADVDHAQGPDLVVVAVGELRWYQAPAWIPHAIESRTLHDVEVADFDRDGDVDLVARNQGGDGNALHFYRQDSPTAWVHASVSLPAGEGLATADVDRDGDVDVVVNGRWFENPGSLPPAGVWAAHVYTTTWTWDASFVAVGDLNGDGRIDAILSPSESAGGSYRISWFEAPPNPRQPWTEHVIDDPVETVHHFVGAADLDGDGDLDVASAEMHQGADPDEVKVYWNGGAGASWTKLVLATTGSHSMRLADVDGDGDVDLFGANWSGPHQPVELWRNRAAILVDGFETGDASRWSAFYP